MLSILSAKHHHHAVAVPSLIIQLIIASPLYLAYDRFYTASKTARQSLLKITKKVKTHVLPTFGVDTTFFSPKNDGTILKDRLGIPADNKVLLYVGRVSPEKNLVGLLRCVKLIREKYKAVTLVIAGPKDPILSDNAANFYLSALNAYGKKLGIDQNTIFMGGLGRSQTAQAYGMCDIFVYPTLSPIETQGLAVLEAMASGKPIVASDWNGIREYVIHGVNGLLASTYARNGRFFMNEQKFASYCLHILENDRMRSIIGNNGRLSSQYYDIKAVLNCYTEKFCHQVEEFEKTPITTRRENSNTLKTLIRQMASDAFVKNITNSSKKILNLITKNKRSEGFLELLVCSREREYKQVASVIQKIIPEIIINNTSKIR